MKTEQRKAYRFDAASGEDLAILKTGKIELNVQVLEKSSVGFRIVLEKMTRNVVGEGQIALLSTVDGCQKVRVVRVQLIEGQIQVGLERLHDVRTQMSAESTLREKKKPRRYLSKFVYLCKVLAVFVAAALICIWGMSHVNAWLFQDVGVKPLPYQGREYAGLNNGNQTHPYEVKLKNVLERLNLFPASDVAKELNLTGKQLQQVNTIIEQTAASLATLYESKDQLTSEEWLDLSLQQINAAWEQIETHLSAEQKKLWKQKFPRQAHDS